MKKYLIALMVVLLSVSAFAAELKVGIRVREGVMNEDQKSGFHYDLVQEFAKRNGYTVKLVVQPNIEAYFDGKVFESCDVVADNITINTKREKKMDFAKILPIKQILVTKQGHARITKLSQLANETIVVTKGTSYYDNIREKAKAAGTEYKYFLSKKADQQIADLLAGKGTVTILDSNLAAMKITEANLILHAAVSSQEYIGWGVKKGDSKLKGELDKFIAEIRKDETISNIWDKYILGIELMDYLTIAGGY